MKKFAHFLITAMMAAAPIQSFAAEAGTKPNPDIGVEQEEPEKLPENSLEQTDKKDTGAANVVSLVEQGAKGICKNTV